MLLSLNRVVPWVSVLIDLNLVLVSLRGGLLADDLLVASVDDLDSALLGLIDSIGVLNLHAHLPLTSLPGDD